MARLTPEELAARLKKAAERITPAVEKGMDLAGLCVEGKAKENCSPDTTPYDKAPFDTGLLRAEIHHETIIEGKTVQGLVISPTEYAIPVHEGTSKMAGRPFLFDAVTESREKVEKILAEHLTEGLEAV